MKKATVYSFLDKKEQEVCKNKNEHLRKALLDAITECRMWVALSWADMYQPVTKKMEVLNTEAEPLIEKQKREPLSEREETRLNALITLYQTVYRPFQLKIWPTVRRARLARKGEVQRKNRYT